MHMHTDNAGLSSRMHNLYPVGSYQIAICSHTICTGSWGGVVFICKDLLSKYGVSRNLVTNAPLRDSVEQNQRLSELPLHPEVMLRALAIFACLASASAFAPSAVLPRTSTRQSPSFPRFLNCPCRAVSLSYRMCKNCGSLCFSGT